MSAPGLKACGSPQYAICQACRNDLQGTQRTLSFFDKLINIVERFLANFVG